MDNEKIEAYIQEIDADELAGRFSVRSVDWREESNAWRDAAIEHSNRANSAERHCDAAMIWGSAGWVLFIVMVVREIARR